MINKTQQILLDQGVDAWILVNAENRDPYYKKMISSNTTIQSVAIITPKKVSVIVHSLDRDNLSSRKDMEEVISYGKNNSFSDTIIEVIREYGLMRKIAFNYTTMNDIATDTLGHGSYMFITNLLKRAIPQYRNKDTFISAEKIIYALYDRKDEEDIHRLRLAAKRANQILLDSFSKIKPGMTETEIVKLVHDLTKEKPSYFEEEGIIDEDYSWEEECCPIVLTGPSFVKGGHAISSEVKVEEGFTVYFDFGVKLTFKDGSQWSSDLQRTGYVLKKGEKAPGRYPL